jgi:hypothetical protein
MSASQAGRKVNGAGEGFIVKGSVPARSDDEARLRARVHFAASANKPGPKTAPGLDIAAPVSRDKMPDVAPGAVVEALRTLPEGASLAGLLRA